MTTPRVMVMHAPGTNRDREAALACRLAGGEPEIVHINQLLAGEQQFERHQMLVLPGGFSYGDDLGAGRLWANDLYHHFARGLEAFIAVGKPVIGICNGFQALVKAGYLPGWPLGPSSPKPTPATGSEACGRGTQERRPWANRQAVTLTFNASGHFECRWVRLHPVGASPCLFTRDLPEDILCPVAHGEGRFLTGDADALRRLWAENLVALTYVGAGYPANPNGSADDIASICNRAGNVLGLMPHPEDHIYPHQHPRWTRGEAGGLGVHLFRNGVRAASAFV